LTKLMRSSTRGLAAVLAVVTTTAVTGGRSKSPASNSLAGTWKVISVDSRRDVQSEWQPEYGATPRGYFMYDTTGHFSLQFCECPKGYAFASRDDKAPTSDEAKNVYLNYLAYFGTYTVDWKQSIVTHHVEGSLMPGYNLTDQERPFVLDGDRLEIGDGRTWRRVLQRVPVKD
jgi:hypothetical protein